MTKTILTAVAAVFIVGGISLFLIWVEKRAKRKAAEDFNNRFQYLDDYYDYYNEFEETPKKSV